MSGSAASPFRHSIAVVIGIDQYGQGIPPLRTAVNDARRVGEILGAHHGYEVIALLDADATRAAIVTLLKETLPARVNGKRPSQAAFFDFEYWLYFRILIAVRYPVTRADPFRSR